MLQPGLAKTLFRTSYQRSPWSNTEREDQPSTQNWPLFEALLTRKCFSYLDYVLTHRLLRHHVLIGEEVALFICHLTLAAKEGHLCVRLGNEQLIPSVEQLWQKEEGELTHEEMQHLTRLMLLGAQQIPLGLLTVLKETAAAMPHTPFCREGNDFYLQRYWVFETQFLKALKKHLSINPEVKFDLQVIQQTVDTLCQNKLLLDKQAQAIVQASLHSFSLVTGGPGTGKTYTAGHLISVLWKHLSKEQKQTFQIVLAAPTGKAAANLQRSLGRVVVDLEDFPPLQAKTLHSLLRMRQGGSQRELPRLTADLVVIDESSMIDVRLMACLFEALKPGSRVILLGDQHQLPSVEAGHLFLDLIQLQQTHPQLNIPCTQLDICVRAELHSLIDFAQLINRGQSQAVLNYLNQAADKGVKRLQFSVDRKEAQNDLIDYALNAFPVVIKAGQTAEEILELFHAIRLLSPMRRGPFGVETLNQLIWQKIAQSMPKGPWLAIPIMVVTNDYRQDLFNGETGVLMRRLPLQTLGLEDYALFPARQAQSPIRKLNALLLPKYEYAYCLSVHKSQGSEFDRVILVLPEGSELFGREVFYTAVTRARQQIEIYGSDVVLSKTVAQQGQRLSGIESRWSVSFSI